MNVEKIMPILCSILSINGLVTMIGIYLLLINQKRMRTNKEIWEEDNEQMEYLKKYKKGGKKDGRNNK